MSDEMVRRDGESIAEFMKRQAAARGLTRADAEVEKKSVQRVKTPSVQHDADLIPDPGFNRAPEEVGMDEKLDSIDIVDAYVRWCGKMVPNVGNKRESIMVSCPIPGHEDRNPSAWLNLDLNVGNCRACGDIGFDKYDIAGWRFNLDPKTDFRELRRTMAIDLGYRVMASADGKTERLVKNDETQERDGAETPGATGLVPPSSTTTGEASGDPDPVLVTIAPASTDSGPEDADTEEPPTPTFDWRDLPGIASDTFLHEWLTVTSQSHEPEEYYFWMGLQALAAAVGNDSHYDDFMPTRGNLMVCLVGATGAGKSISMSFFTKLLREALHWESDTGSGVRHIIAPDSGEALLDQFNHVVVDPSTNEKRSLPVNGLYREDELASFVKRTGRNGNTMREVVMNLFDTPQPVGTKSRGGGEVEARDHFMQMITSTQPAAMRRLLTDADAAAGFLNRWLFATGSYKVRPALNATRIDITPAVEPLRRVRAWAAADRLVQFRDGPAADLWTKFHDEKLVPLTMSEDDDAWLVARLPLLAKKIMFLLAVNERLETVMVEHVQTVIDLWDYLVGTYGLVGRSIGVDELEDCTSKIEEYARKHSEELLTFRQFQYSSGARKYRRETILRALENLVKAGVLDSPEGEVDAKGKPKSRVKRYRYVAATATPLATVTSIAAAT